jgi:hypothetical protein
MNKNETNNEQHQENCRRLEATTPPSTFVEYRVWVALWKNVYQEETKRARAYRMALKRFHQAGGSGRKRPLFPMTLEIEAAAQRTTSEYSRKGRARLSQARVAYKPIGAALWAAARVEERI